MENAVKALYIAAGVLIAVMVLSLAAVLYASLQGYVEDSNKQIKYNDVNSFNTKYLNYINYNNDGTKNFNLTIQDVITVASNAYENNKSLNSDSNQWVYYEKSLYLNVNIIDGSTGWSIDKNINESMVKLLEDYKEAEFKCTPADVLISEFTGQVYWIAFHVI